MMEKASIEWQTLKLLWKRAMHWFAASRGETADTRYTPSWKLRSHRKLAEGCFDRYAAQAEKMLDHLQSIGVINISGPEIERQQFVRRPPRRNGFKEAA